MSEYFKVYADEVGHFYADLNGISGEPFPAVN